MRRIIAALALLLQPPWAAGAAPHKDATPEDAIPEWQWHMVPNRDGVPPMIRAIVQTPDGYLWLGSYYGIHRFDGVHLQPLPPSSEKPLQSTDVASLLPTVDNRLWVGHDWGGLSVVQGDSHSIVAKPYLATVPFLRANAAGTAWAVAGNGKTINVARLIDGRWVVWAQWPKGYMMSAAVGQDGSLWFIVNHRLLLASPTSHSVKQVLPGPIEDATLAADGDGQVWLAMRGSMQRLFSGGNGVGPRLGPKLAKPMAAKLGPTVFDGAQDFWTIEDDALVSRYHLDKGGQSVRIVGRWRSPTPLPSPAFALTDTPMFVDREHNLWIGTTQGLLRFSRAAFTLVVRPLITSAIWAIPYGTMRDGRDDLWQWREHDLFSVGRDGALIPHPEAASSIPFSPCPGFAGGVWMPRDDHTLSLIGGPTRRTLRLTEPHPFAQIVPSDCVEDSQGRLWADTANDGLVLFGPGGRAKVPLGEDSGHQVLNMVAIDHGRVIAYIGHGSLWQSDGVRTTKLWDEKTMALGSIEVMVRSGSQVLLGGDRGLARYDGHSFAMLSSRRFPFLATTTGITQTLQGESWLQTSKGAIRLKTADLQRAFDDPAFQLRPQIFTINDGLPGTAAFFNISNINADPLGRIWVTTDSGIARHDPGKHWALAPPPVVITGLATGNEHVAAAPRIVLPPGAGRIRIDFAALSFADPDRARFRYRLLGVDTDWVDAGDERSASYTRLAPGTYRFEVTAANNAGVWNPQGATMTVIEPALFYQSWWFSLLVAASAVLGGWALYRWRVGIVSRRLREHAAQRAQERERVARDIHDTLLQSIQGLVLRFQSVAGKMAPTDPNRSLLETTLDRADDLIAQGKERVHGLRDDDRPLSLPALIREQLDEAPFPLDVERQLLLSGAPVDVTTAVALEIREIVSEALFNAARHAGASAISIEASYGPKALQVTISDNGIGIAPATGSRSGGYGLVGMRGRAESIGAALTIAGGSAGGTLVALRIPARRAYVMQSPWWKRGEGRP